MVKQIKSKTISELRAMMATMIKQQSELIAALTPVKKSRKK